MLVFLLLCCTTTREIMQPFSLVFVFNIAYVHTVLRFLVLFMSGRQANRKMKEIRRKERGVSWDERHCC